MFVIVIVNQLSSMISFCLCMMFSGLWFSGLCIALGFCAGCPKSQAVLRGTERASYFSAFYGQRRHVFPFSNHTSHCVLPGVLIKHLTNERPSHCSLLNCCHLCVPKSICIRLMAQSRRFPRLFQSKLCALAMRRPSTTENKWACQCFQSLHSSPPCFIVCGSLHKAEQ